MILEHALLPVLDGREQEFEEAMSRAKQFIAGAPGFRGMTVSRCVERPNVYLLLVRWERLEDHTEGFRTSAAYRSWKQLLHHFYDPFPTVEHFVTVEEA
jgi:heme-degrading monooxygenase HmoA